MHVGIIEPERLKQIPSSLHSAHEFCFFLHDQIVHLLSQLEASGVKQVQVKLSSEAESKSFAETEDVFLWLETHHYGNTLKELIINETALALFTDASHFLFEGLKALEKRKFAVAFALFRKPLKENLLLAAWLLAEPNTFYQHMAQLDGRTINSTIEPSRRREILRKAASLLDNVDQSTIDLIERSFFERSGPDGFASVFDKATHLTTSHKRYSTEPLNLNFIFLDPRSDHLYHQFYPVLIFAICFLLRVQMKIYSTIQPTNPNVERWLNFAMIGVHHSLFASGKSVIAKWLNELFADQLVCTSCDTGKALRKTDLPKLFLAEKFACLNCGCVNSFPLFWLMTRAFDYEDTNKHC